MQPLTNLSSNPNPLNPQAQHSHNPHVYNSRPAPILSATSKKVQSSPSLKTLQANRPLQLNPFNSNPSNHLPSLSLLHSKPKTTQNASQVQPNNPDFLSI